MNTITIHQPNFLPWSGFFAKMQRSDLMVLLDHVQFSKNNYTNRTKIRTQNGWKWLTVPVPKHSNHKTIFEVPLHPEIRWREKHKKMLCFQYAKAPYFDKSIVDNIYSYSHGFQTLADFNIFGINIIKELANIDTTLIRSSELSLSNDSKSQLLAEIVKKLDGNKYLSGPDGRKYLDTSPFVKSGIEIEFFDFPSAAYRQTFSGFELGLTALDCFFNTGNVLTEENECLKKQK